MARTVLNRHVTPAAPFTVPAGKVAVFKAYWSQSDTTSVRVLINGQNIGFMTSNTNPSAGPLVAAGGDVVSATGNHAFGLSGFLYDA